MLLKPINYFSKLIKSAKISIKLTIMYAFMFSLVLLILNASILFGIKYYLYSQANKQIDDVKTMILNKVASQNNHINLSDKDVISDVPTKENVSVRILQGDGKVLNISNQFNYTIKVEEPYYTIVHLE